MLARRIDQENTVHHQQAAKSLNGAKTPAAKAPKTPFGKSALKKADQENDVTVATKKGKGVQLDKNTFITPAGTKTHQYRTNVRELTGEDEGPRTRAPLGFKTTNAKATAFQTPTGKQVSSEREGLLCNFPDIDHAIRVKQELKPSEKPRKKEPDGTPGASVLQQFVGKNEAPRQVVWLNDTEWIDEQGRYRDLDEEQDLPYGGNWPGPPAEIPNVPTVEEEGFDADGFRAKMQAALSQPPNFRPIFDEEEVRARAEKQQKEHREAREKEIEQGLRQFDKDMDEMEQELREELGLPRTKPKRTVAKVDTTKARDAASLLAAKSSDLSNCPTKEAKAGSAALVKTHANLRKNTPSYAAPTAASKAHQQPVAHEAEKARRAAAIAASKSTVSYNKGRRVSAKLKETSNVTSSFPALDGTADTPRKETGYDAMLCEIDAILNPRETAEELQVEDLEGEIADTWKELDDEVFQIRMPELH